LIGRKLVSKSRDSIQYSATVDPLSNQDILFQFVLIRFVLKEDRDFGPPNFLLFEIDSGKVGSSGCSMTAVPVWPTSLLLAEHPEYEIAVDVLLICGFDPRMPPNPRNA
jgi:hypothetical protein